jgi:RNA polymerase sigma-70 factor (ECF subfamily)
MNLSPAQIDALAVEVQQGRTEAFRDLFEALYADLRLFVARRSSTADMADEVVQETFVAAFEGISRYRPGGAFTAWLRGIALHKLREERDRRVRSPSLDVSVIEAALAKADAGDPCPGGADDGLRDRLARCLDRLPPQSRRLVMARYASGQRLQDVAASMSRSVGYLSVALNRIRRGLRLCLEQGGIRV